MSNKQQEKIRQRIKKRAAIKAKKRALKRHHRQTQAADNFGFNNSDSSNFNRFIDNTTSDERSDVLNKAKPVVSKSATAVFDRSAWKPKEET